MNSGPNNTQDEQAIPRDALYTTHDSRKRSVSLAQKKLSLHTGYCGFQVDYSPVLEARLGLGAEEEAALW